MTESRWTEGQTYPGKGGGGGGGRIYSGQNICCPHLLVAKLLRHVYLYLVITLSSELMNSDVTELTHCSWWKVQTCMRNIDDLKILITTVGVAKN